MIIKTPPVDWVNLNPALARPFRAVLTVCMRCDRTIRWDIFKEHIRIKVGDSLMIGIDGDAVYLSRGFGATPYSLRTGLEEAIKEIEKELA